MLLALILASGSALLGGALALLVRRQRALLELTRTFAFAAAAGVVLLHLLPEALEAIGVRGFVWAAVGFALPGLLEWRAKSLGPALRARGLSSSRVAAEIGFVALFVHSLLEGVALCAAARGSGSHLDLEIALVAHHAPLTAAVILPFLGLLGPGGVALRVLGIALAGAAGAIFGGTAPVDFSASMAQQIASSVMAGALLHVVADEIRPQKFEARWERWADLAAALMGAGIALVSAAFSGGLSSPFAAALFALALPCAPFLLAADLMAVLLAGRFGKSRALAPRPELDAIFVSVRALGFVAAAAQLLLGLAAQALSSAFAPGEARPVEPNRGFADRLLAQAESKGPRRLAAFLLGGTALWMLRDRAAASVLAQDLPLIATALTVAAVLLLAALSASVTTLLAAVLLDLQLDFLPAPAPALLVTALAIAPLVLRKSAWRGGSKRRLTGALLALLLGASVAILLARPAFDDRVREHAFTLLANPAQPLLARLAASPLESSCAALIAAIALASLWRAGARAWFAGLRLL